MDDISEFGPAMARLTAKQRRFVQAMMADPFGTGAGWARRAGYSDKSEAAKVKAHYLLHSSSIEAAVLEVGRDMLTARGPIVAVAAMLKAAADPEHPKQLQAAEMILNRVGLHETQEIRVTRTDQTGAAMVERIRALAAALGVDPAQLLGANVQGVQALPKVIEGKVVDES